jgi:hypothetical protein
MLSSRETACGRGEGSHDEAARRRGEAAGRSRWGALAFRDVSDRFDAEDAPGVLAKLTGYELWERTQRAGQQLATAYERTIGARSEQERVAVALEFLRRMRQLLALRLVAVAGDRRQAFPQRVPPASGHGVAALWAEVFWAARARSPEDGSGVLEATDASIRGLLALDPSDLADPDSLRAWWERLQLVEETFGGLEMEAQATVERLRVAVDDERQVRPETS